MLSYRHAFHAGNHADCLKHLILTRVLTYLGARPDAATGTPGIPPVLGGSPGVAPCTPGIPPVLGASPGVAPCTPGIPPVLGGKDKPICYCETHAGPGLYAFDSPQAQQNREYLGGIARLWGRQDLPLSLAAYVALVRDCNGPGELRRYPGSPWLAQRLLRPGDRLILHELHSAEIDPLRNNFADDRRVQVIAGDGYRGLLAAVPPRERRGLVLIDPAYEIKSDYQQVIEALSLAHRRFPTGVYALWYPVVERGRIDALERAIARSGIRRVQRYELAIRDEGRGSGMVASGVLVVNPPWTLLEDLRPALHYLAQALGEGGAGRFRAEQLVGE